MTAIDPGQLRHRVTVRAPLTTQDALGQPTVGHTDVCTVWAEVRYASGTEALKADAPVSSVRASIRVRRRADINAGHMAVHGTTVFNILAVQPADHPGFMFLVCEAAR
jgi:SPP1 family predicted phage head-tail adaptor